MLQKKKNHNFLEVSVLIFHYPKPGGRDQNSITISTQPPKKSFASAREKNDNYPKGDHIAPQKLQYQTNHAR